MNRRWRGVLARGMTLSGLAQRGFFIPYRYAAKVAGSGERPPYRAVETLLRSREDSFRAFLSTIDGFSPELERIGTEAPPAPRWTQDWFPRLDAAAAYALVRSLKPRRVVEVGAGHSTRFVVRAIRDGSLDPTAQRTGRNALGTAVLRDDPSLRIQTHLRRPCDTRRCPQHFDLGVSQFFPKAKTQIR